jgi:hypothetical protein
MMALETIKRSRDIVGVRQHRWCWCQEDQTFIALETFHPPNPESGDLWKEENG